MRSIDGDESTVFVDRILTRQVMLSDCHCFVSGLEKENLLLLFPSSGRVLFSHGRAITRKNRKPDQSIKISIEQHTILSVATIYHLSQRDKIVIY